VNTPEKYEGTFVRVSGTVEIGLGSFYVWESHGGADYAIDLADPNHLDDAEISGLTWEKDELHTLFFEGVRPLANQLIADSGGRPLPARKPVRITATLVGRLDQAGKFTYRDKQGRQVTARGYGHNGSLKVRLVVTAVESITFSR